MSDILTISKENKCGLLINPPLVMGSKAVVSIGIIYNPKAVTDYLLFLEFKYSENSWKVLRTEIIGFNWVNWLEDETIYLWEKLVFFF